MIVTLNGCSSDTSNIIHVSNVGLDNFDKPNAFNAYPNPVTNELIIEISGNRDEIGFEIYNSIGQLMFEDKMKEKTKISTANFVAGMYLIKLENGKKFEFKKIIKEN